MQCFECLAHWVYTIQQNQVTQLIQIKTIHTIYNPDYLVLIQINRLINSCLLGFACKVYFGHGYYYA